MNASVTTRQAGRSKKMAEARLSFEEHKAITSLIQFFPFLKCVYIFWHPVYNTSFLCWFGTCMFSEMKNPPSANLTLYPPRGMACVDSSRRCDIHDLLFHICSLKWSNGVMKCPVGLMQVAIVTRHPVLWIEKKISEAGLSIPKFSYP
jgi:hypothetical protein